MFTKYNVSGVLLSIILGVASHSLAMDSPFSDEGGERLSLLAYQKKEEEFRGCSDLTYDYGGVRFIGFFKNHLKRTTALFTGAFSSLPPEVM